MVVPIRLSNIGCQQPSVGFHIVQFSFFPPLCIGHFFQFSMLSNVVIFLMLVFQFLISNFNFPIRYFLYTTLLSNFCFPLFNVDFQVSSVSSFLFNVDFPLFPMFTPHHVSCVTCHMSRFMCHLSPVSCHIYFLFSFYIFFFI